MRNQKLLLDLKLDIDSKNAGVCKPNLKSIANPDVTYDRIVETK